MERREFIKAIGVLRTAGVIFPQDIFSKEILGILNNNIIIKDDLEYRNNPSLKKVMITIDDGPSKFSVSIADELDKLGLKGTFFLLGKNIDYYKNDVIEILNKGHKIGNHSYSHPVFAKISLKKAYDEVKKTDNIIRNLLSQSNQNPEQEMYFRYPYGSKIAKSKEKEFDTFLESMKLKTLFWDIDTNDWRKDVSIDNIKNQILAGMDNNIILIHDRKKSLESLALI